MRIESSVTSITWIPSEAIEGMPKLPFEWGLAHYDDPPHDRLLDIEAMHENDLFREANELKAWVEVDDGKITDCGYSGGGVFSFVSPLPPPPPLPWPPAFWPWLRAVPGVVGCVRWTGLGGFWWEPRAREGGSGLTSFTRDSETALPTTAGLP